MILHVKLRVDPYQAANARERRRMDRMNEAFIRLVPDFAKSSFYRVLSLLLKRLIGWVMDQMNREWCSYLCKWTRANANSICLGLFPSTIQI